MFICLAWSFRERRCLRNPSPPPSKSQAGAGGEEGQPLPRQASLLPALLSQTPSSLSLCLQADSSRPSESQGRRVGYTVASGGLCHLSPPGLTCRLRRRSPGTPETTVVEVEGMHQLAGKKGCGWGGSQAAPHGGAGAPGAGEDAACHLLPQLTLVPCALPALLSPKGSWIWGF